MPLITSIVQNKKNKKFYSVFIDGKFRFSLSENDLTFLDLKENQNISRDKLNQFVEEYSIQKARRYAYLLVSKKLYSKNKFIEKLQNKKFPEETINKIIEELKEYKYINDRELIYEYAKNKVELKPMGRYRLQRELFNQRFKEDDIKECLERIYTEFDEGELAQKAVAARFKKSLDNVDEGLLKKINNFLLSRGFNYDIINDIIKSIRENRRKDED